MYFLITYYWNIEAVTDDRPRQASIKTIGLSHKISDYFLWAWFSQPLDYIFFILPTIFANYLHNIGLKWERNRITFVYVRDSRQSQFCLNKTTENSSHRD